MALSLAASTFFNPQNASSQVSIGLYDFVIHQSESLDLADIAQITAPDDLLERIRYFSIGASPPSDFVQSVTREQVSRLLSAELEASFYGAPRTYLLRKSDSVKAVDLQDILQQYCHNLAGDSLKIYVKVSNPEDVLFTKCFFPLRCAIRLGSFPSPGSRIITIEYTDARDRIQRCHLKVECSLYANLVYPDQIIKRGQVIQADDVQIQLADISEIPHQNLVYCPENIIGLQAQRHLAPGSPIRWDQVCLPPQVHKGSTIELVLHDEQYEIKTSATALESGSTGERIWVKLESNGKRIRAVVVDADRVTLR